jgi:hypothetical protein
LQLGKSSDGKASYTYVNRGINFRGGLGKQLTFLQPFSKVKVVSPIILIGMQSRYFQTAGTPAAIPGVGIAKDFKTDSYDFL